MLSLAGSETPVKFKSLIRTQLELDLEAILLLFLKERQEQPDYDI
jgi:hypothetical protein